MSPAYLAPAHAPCKPGRDLFRRLPRTPSILSSISAKTEVTQPRSRGPLLTLWESGSSAERQASITGGYVRALSPVSVSADRSFAAGPAEVDGAPGSDRWARCDCPRGAPLVASHACADHRRGNRRLKQRRSRTRVGCRPTTLAVPTAPFHGGRRSRTLSPFIHRIGRCQPSRHRGNCRPGTSRRHHIPVREPTGLRIAAGNSGHSP